MAVATQPPITPAYQIRWVTLRAL